MIFTLKIKYMYVEDHNFALFEFYFIVLFIVH